MTKRIVSSFQMTEADARKFDALEQAGFGTRTDIIRIALDRLYIQEIKTMKYNYTTGTKGSVITLQDGRYADTVHGDTSENMEPNAALAALLDETEHPGWIATNETLGDLTPAELQKYVGA